LGSVLTEMLSEKYEVHSGYLNSPAPVAAPARRLRFDIRDSDQVRRAFEIARPDCVIHTAALSQPDYCEAQPGESCDVNVTATVRVARECKSFGAKLIHISTDLVFDGAKGHYSEEDPVRGLSEYSRSKIRAEQAVLAGSPAAVILRVSVMYGPR